MAGYYEHGTEVMGFKKQTPCGPAQQQSALHERKILSIQLVRSWCRNSTLYFKINIILVCMSFLTIQTYMQVIRI